MIDMIKTLDKHPPMHISGIAEEWEQKNQDRFVHLIGIFRRSNVIIGEKNFKRFSHPYLESNKFINSRYIFLDDESTPEELQKEYFTTLNKFHPRTFTKQVRQKVEIRNINYKTNAGDIDLLLRGNLGGYEIFDAFWAFQMEEGNQIAFLGVRGEYVDNIINLKRGETLEKAALFEKLWELGQKQNKSKK